MEESNDATIGDHIDTMRASPTIYGISRQTIEGFQVCIACIVNQGSIFSCVRDLCITYSLLRPQRMNNSTVLCEEAKKLDRKRTRIRSDSGTPGCNTIAVESRKVLCQST